MRESIGREGIQERCCGGSQKGRGGIHPLISSLSSLSVEAMGGPAVEGKGGRQASKRYVVEPRWAEKRDRVS